MELTDLIGTAIGVLGFAGTVATAFVAWGVMKRSVQANTDEIADVKKEQERLQREVDEAQKSARAVEGLAAAVEHMGQRFTDQLKHLVDTFAIENTHTRSQLSEIKDELKSVRGAPRARSTRAKS